MDKVRSLMGYFYNSASNKAPASGASGASGSGMGSDVITKDKVTAKVMGALDHDQLMDVEPYAKKLLDSTPGAKHLKDYVKKIKMFSTDPRFVERLEPIRTNLLKLLNEVKE